MSLPILTTAEDVSAIIKYLATKPTGATIEEAKAVLNKAVLDGRKIAAYEMWGLIQKEGGRFKLSPRGWNIARKPEQTAEAYREIIDSVPPYRSILEWAHHQEFDVVTNLDVAAQWHEHHSDELGTEHERTIKDQATCFFRVCEAAELGQMTLGRKGQPTRLTLNASALKTLIESGPSAPPWNPLPHPDAEAEDKAADEEETVDEQSTDVEEHQQNSTESQYGDSSSTEAEVQVFISHGKNTDLVEQVETMLGLADIDSEVAVKEETAAIPVPEKVFAAMRRCTAGIIIVSAEESEDGESDPRINENVLIEIGAAFVLYDKKVVLLWDKKLPVPSNLQGLYRCEFDGEELSWSAGMKLMKAIKNFK